MANNINGNPWILDSAAVIKTTPVNINTMEWIPNATSDNLTILDNAGNEFWDVDALTGGTAGKETFKLSRPIKVNGFNLSVIDGGTLRVYII